MTHPHAACRAIVLTCIDYRTVTPVQEALAERGLGGGADVVSWPGGALRLTADGAEAVLDAIAIADRLHEPEELLLVVHRDCGWLGGSAAFASDDEERSRLDEGLTTAADVARSKFPELRVTTLRLDIHVPADQATTGSAEHR